MTFKKPKTMAEFAEVVGLSRQTVSRFFNDPQSVRAATRIVIERGLSQFDYQPNFHASSLTRRKSKAIGIIVPSIIDPFYSELVSTIELYAEERGYLTVLQCSHNDPAMESRALTRLLSINVQGIAMAPVGFRTDIELVEVARRETPVVVVDSRLQAETSHIGTNNRQSMTLMVDYLCRSGEPPSLFSMPAVNVNIVERKEAYTNRMKELGHDPFILNPEAVLMDDDYERFGFEQFLTMPRERVEKSTTILCLNDRIAIGLLSAAAHLGMQVGKGADCDLRVAGHDDQHFSQYASPPLTTVAQDTKALAVLAARALLDNEGENDLMINGKLINATLRLRESA